MTPADASPAPDQRTWLGIDAGSSCIKVVVRSGSARLARRLPSQAAGDVANWVLEQRADGVGLTGAGGQPIADALGERCPTATLDEFHAWGKGSRILLDEHGVPVGESFLFVSVGTGTSASVVTNDGVERVGGCALGGGTLMGLGRWLVGTDDHDEIVTLAAEGNRSGVDLEIADVYPHFPRGLTASNFGGPDSLDGADRPKCDLAAALAVMIGENVSLLCNSLARTRGISDIVYGGGTLSNNPVTWDIIAQMAQMGGHRAIPLPEGTYTGAEGALSAIRDG